MMVKHLAIVAMLSIATQPILANPCVSCIAAKKPVRAKKPPVNQILRVEREVAAVVTVFQPVYLSQVTPAPAITYNLSVPAPPPAPTQQTFIAPPSITTAVGAQTAYGVQGQQQQQQVALTLEQRMERLEASVGKLCDTLAGGAVAADHDGKRRGFVVGPQGVPSFFGTHCAVCHNTTAAAKDGGGFVLFDRGQMANLSERELRKMYQHHANQTMPPANNSKGIPPLTPAQLKEWDKWLRSQE